MWILPGSTEQIDCLALYNTLSSLGFNHFSVNHSRNLVSSDGIHTNGIEGIFGCMKRMRRKYDAYWSGVSNLNLYLAVFCFRYSFNCCNRKNAFIKLHVLLKKVKEDLNNEIND